MKQAIPNHTVRYSPRAKNLRLKVTREGGLTVIIPKGYDEKNIPTILKKKKDWITAAIKRVGETKRFLEPAPNTHLPILIDLKALGEKWSVTYTIDTRYNGLRIQIEKGRLIISGPRHDRDAVIRKLHEWLRKKVRNCLFPLAKDQAAKHRLEIRGLLVKSQQTRWASFSAKKNLSLNTKLLFISPDLVRYVLVHELCHSVHMHHRKDFWNLVKNFEPDYHELDSRLRTAWREVPQWLFSKN